MSATGVTESAKSSGKGANAYEANAAKSGGGAKKWLLIGGGGTLLVFTLICVGLYLLGGADQSALERVRDIAIILIVLSSLLTVILLAAVTVALVILLIAVKDKIIPLLEELTGTARRVRGTTDFMTEEAVRPLVSAASSYARVRAMMRTVVMGPQKKR